MAETKVVRATAATVSASVARDPRKYYAIHWGSGHVSYSQLCRASIVRVRPSTCVGDKDCVRACLTMHVGRRLQPGNKVSAARVVRFTEAIYQRANQHLHGPAHVQHGCVRLPVLQQVGADQLVKVSHRR
eukprot:6178877-Pleurochrysis_carterae.AAC.2